MTNEIKILAAKLLSEEVIIASWGITSVKIGDVNLHFCVDGLKYKGQVRINSLGGGMYDVILGEANHSTQNLEKIIEYLDNAIERTDTYIHDLEVWFNKMGKAH